MMKLLLCVGSRDIMSNNMQHAQRQADLNEDYLSMKQRDQVRHLAADKAEERVKEQGVENAKSAAATKEWGQADVADSRNYRT
jgi:hypothetical protein